MTRCGVALACAGLVFLAVPAAAQPGTGGVRFGAQLAVVNSGEFDTDVGVGATLAWFPVPLVGAEAELSLYPGDLGEPAFSGHRVEGLFGASVGPALRRVRPFVKARAGFVRYAPAPAPIACIAIFPPPLACMLAAGDTLPALDLGGGVELFPTAATFVRIDAGDRLVRYPGPVIDADFEVRSDAFFGHDVRVTVGAGVRF